MAVFIYLILGSNVSDPAERFFCSLENLVVYCIEMKKLFMEIILVAVFVISGTLVMYRYLVGIAGFWNAQIFWSFVLLICWTVVAFGYCRQGWLVRKAKSALHVSVLLPTIVFIVQCILFIKGVYYNDFALIIGAVLVNCGVVFDLYQILRVK